MPRYFVYRDRAVRDLETWINQHPGRMVHLEQVPGGDYLLIMEVSDFRLWAKRRGQQWHQFKERVAYWVEYYSVRARAIPHNWRNWLKERL